MNTQEAITILNDYMLRDTEIGEAIHYAIEYMSSKLSACEEDARIAKRGAPEGWQLVPKEPYIKMVDAGEIHASSSIEDLVSECRSRVVRVYEAMLSVAPEPPQERND